jgi:hypothetical protein
MFAGVFTDGKMISKPTCHQAKRRSENHPENTGFLPQLTAINKSFVHSPGSATTT